METDPDFAEFQRWKVGRISKKALLRGTTPAPDSEARDTPEPALQPCPECDVTGGHLTNCREWDKDEAEWMASSVQSEETAVRAVSPVSLSPNSSVEDRVKHLKRSFAGKKGDKKNAANKLKSFNLASVLANIPTPSQSARSITPLVEGANIDDLAKASLELDAAIIEVVDETVALGGQKKKSVQLLGQTIEKNDEYIGIVDPPDENGKTTYHHASRQGSAASDTGQELPYTEEDRRYLAQKKGVKKQWQNSFAQVNATAKAAADASTQGGQSGAKRSWLGGIFKGKTNGAGPAQGQQPKNGQEHGAPFFIPAKLQSRLGYGTCHVVPFRGDR